MKPFKPFFGGSPKKRSGDKPDENKPDEIIPVDEWGRREEMPILEDLQKKEVVDQEQQEPLKEEGVTKGTAAPEGETASGEKVPENREKPQTKEPIKTYGGKTGKGSFGKPFEPKTFVVDTKLTIILVENTNEVAMEKDKLKAIIKKLVKTGQICVINYGNIIRVSKIVEANSFNGDMLFDDDSVGDNACFYDAICIMEEVVDENYKKTKDLKGKRVRIQNIDIIGLGTCRDNCSISTSKIAGENFRTVAKHTDVTTKYFCLKEDSFIAAATIGFHSIGAIARNYM